MEKRMIYDDGEIYDLQNSFDREDISFYEAVVDRFGGPVLELACGTGVLGIPIARKGYRVTGLDISQGMIRQAIAKTKGMSNIEFVLGNMTDFDLGKKFKTIFMGFNSICHLYDYPEIQSMLTCVRNHLDVGGIFILDCFIPNPGYFCRDKDRHYEVFDKGDLKISETNEYDVATQINHIKWHYEYKGEDWLEDLDMRMYYPREIQNYLRINGMEVIEKYGNHRFGEFGGENSFQIYLCRNTR